MMNIFLDHFWIFELTHIVFELGPLNAIFNFDAPKMLEIDKGHWNNSESAHEYFQDF